MMFEIKKIMVALLAVSALTACSHVRDSIGLTRQAPDEFEVYSRAPLSMPPDYALRPPVAGAARPDSTTTREDAEVTVFGGGNNTTNTANNGSGNSSAESSILSAAGAADAQPGIREIVDAETGQMVAEDERFADRLIFWQEHDAPATEVDANAEAQRIRDANGNVTGDGTEVIEQDRNAPFENIFH